MFSLFSESLVNSMPAKIMVLGVATLVGYYAGGLVRRLKLPSIIGYMVVGVILGPSLFHVLTGASLSDLSFVTNVALGFVALSIGAELRVKALRNLGSGIIGIILGSSFLAFFLVMIGVFAYFRDWPMALVFAAMAPATAPAGTVAVIQECKAKGKLTQALYAVVGFDDGLAIIIYAFAAALAKALLLSAAGMNNGGFMTSLVGPVLELIGSILIGGFMGFLFGFIVRRMNSTPDILILLFSFVLLATGLAMLLHLSLILTNMCIGFVLVNTRSNALVKRATEPLRTIMPLIFVMFFCLAGAHLHLQQLMGLGMLGLIYILCRSAGKVFGAMLGARFGTVSPEVRKWTGVGILSQAGVAIGLSLVVQEEFRQMSDELAKVGGDLTQAVIRHPMVIGDKLIVTITASCIFFEIIGPILTKLALDKAGEIPPPQPIPGGSE